MVELPYWLTGIVVGVSVFIGALVGVFVGYCIGRIKFDDEVN